MKSMKATRCIFVMALVIIMTLVNVTGSFAATLGSGSQGYRLTVLNAIGVADDSYNSEAACTRGEFAKLLVLSSSYNEEGQVALTSAAANDVPATSANASYIKLALNQGWMRTRLGGNFWPDAPITLNDAVKATLTILGYTDEDFPNNVLSKRLAMFKSLGLDEGITASDGNDALTLRDAVNIIYNLLNTDTKAGSLYGSAINLTRDTDDGELDATNVMETKMVGPILVKSKDELESAFPFNIGEGTYYVNGTNYGSYGRVYMERQIELSGWLIVYYNEATRTIFAYGGDNSEGATYRTLRGRVTSIEYKDVNIATPSAVYINGSSYTINSDEVKFMFSLNGSIKVGDIVVVVLRAGNSTTVTLDEDNTSTATEYYIAAVVKWDSDGVAASSNVNDSV